MASTYRSDSWVRSVLGQAIAGALVYVCNQPANTASIPPSPLASIFLDPNGLVPLAQPVVCDGFGHADWYSVPGTYTVVVVNFGQVQAVYPDQTVIGFASTTSLVAGANINITGLTISAVNVVVTNPVGPQTILSNNLLPATGNPGNQSLGSAAAPWIGYFSEIFLTGAQPSVELSQDPFYAGYVETSSGLHINNSLVVDSGVIIMKINDAYVQWADGGQVINVQAGPRGAEAVITGVSLIADSLVVTTTGDQFAPTTPVYLTIPAVPFLNGQVVTVLSSTPTSFTANFTAPNYSNPSVPQPAEAVANFLLASSTLNLPDVTGGTDVPNSGWMLAVTTVTNETAVGHGLFYSTGGVLIDSGIGFNHNVSFTNNTVNGIEWVSGANSILVTAPTPTGNYIFTLPNVGGTALVGIATAATATAGAIAPTDFVGFLEVNLPNGTVVKVPYYSV